MNLTSTREKDMPSLEVPLRSSGGMLVAFLFRHALTRSKCVHEQDYQFSIATVSFEDFSFTRLARSPLYL